jgi:hypothetical protein
MLKLWYVKKRSGRPRPAQLYKNKRATGIAPRKKRSGGGRKKIFARKGGVFDLRCGRRDEEERTGRDGGGGIKRDFVIKGRPEGKR